VKARSLILAFLAACSPGSVDRGPGGADLTEMTKRGTAAFTATLPKDPDLPLTFTGTVTLVLQEGHYAIKKGEMNGTLGELRIEDESILFIETPAPEGAFNCYVDGARTLVQGTGTYTYDFDGRRLELDATDEPCPTRELVLEQSWRLMPEASD
jgi:hypothetical protein